MTSSRSVTSTRRTGRRLPTALFAALLFVVASAVPSAADVSFINGRRSDAGLRPVADSGGLASVAASHSRSMANNNTLAHSTNLGSKVSSVLPGWQAVGENVGVGSSLSAVNSMFMGSSTHRANILGNYTHAGVGTFTGPDGRVWVTQVFARMPAGATATTVAAASTSGTATRTAASTDTRSTTSRVSRSAPRTTPRIDVALPPRTPLATAGLVARGTPGYFVIADDGGVFAYDGAPFAGSAADLPRNAPIVDAAGTSTGKGYLLFASDGGVFTFGDATFAGSAASSPLNAPIIAGALSPTARGYRLFGADGGVFAFGDSSFIGSLVGTTLNAPITAAASTVDGDGYLLAGRDGGVFAFGEAPFYGGLAGYPLGAPIVDVALTRSGDGYWLVGVDGAVFAFGDAHYLGGLNSSGTPSAVAGIIPATTGKGYWLVTEDKQVTGFGQVGAPPESMLRAFSSLDVHRL